MLEIYQEIVRLMQRGERAVVATVISSYDAPRETASKMLVKQDGSIVGTVGGGALEHAVRHRAKEVLETGVAQVMHFDLTGKKDRSGMICGGEAQVFLEPVLPLESLYLCGAGHISQAVAAIGKMLGFRISVIDPRAEYNNSERFPGADSLIVEEYRQAFSRLDIGKDAYIVIVTPGHAFDEQCLEWALGTKAKYIGMIGSQNKVATVKSHLLARGVPQARLDQVHSPIGLKIEAETPQEIAVSILAEIIQVRRSGMAKT
jgi:xanthine dehydrogenase accessory factor